MTEIANHQLSQQPTPMAWGGANNDSAFDILDESWRQEQQPLTTSQSKDENDAHAHSVQTTEQRIPSSSASTVKEAPITSVHQSLSTLDSGWRSSDETRHSKAETSKRSPQRRQRRSSGAVTDSELLQPGPSSTSRRIPSHKLPWRGADTSSDDRIQESLSLNSSPYTSFRPRDDDVQSGSSALQRPSSPSSSSHNSAEKLGDVVAGNIRTFSRTNSIKGKGREPAQITRLRDRSEHQYSPSLSGINAEQFGSAMEDMSANEAAVTATEEGTFIEHSNVASPPAFLKPAWQKDKSRMQKDMFGPSPLQALFLSPPSASATKDEKKVEEEQQKVEKEKVQDQTHDHRSNDSTLSQEDDPATDQQHPTDALTEDDPLSDQQHPTDALTEDDPAIDQQHPTEVLIEDHQNLSNSGKHEDDQSVDNTSSSVVSATSPIMPKSVFTFASPIPSRASKPLPTPSASHAPLRLFHLRGRNPEVEQILNTPRSSLKNDDAKRLVYNLVQEERRGEREKKRLRMDRKSAPSPANEQPDLPNNVASDEADDEDDDAEAQISDKVAEKGMEREEFGTSDIQNRVRALRLTSDGSNRTSSSLLAMRRGAKAPTPERANENRDFLNIGQQSDESPRKMLRRWSAANQIDEEIEDEEELVEADGKGENDGEAQMSTAAKDGFQVPRVSVDPPPKSPNEKHIPSNSRHSSAAQTSGRSGLQNIAPSAIDAAELEALSRGKMTYNRENARWDRVESLRKNARANATGDAGQTACEDSSDPFRELDSSSSPVHQAATQELAENESANDLASPDNRNLSLSGLSPLPTRGDHHAPHSSIWSPTAAAGAIGASLLTPAKLPGADVRGTTPRSILKTAGSVKGKRRGLGRGPSDPATPTLARQVSRKISFADGIDPMSNAPPSSAMARKEFTSLPKGPKMQKKERLTELLQQLTVVAMGSDGEDVEGSLRDGAEEYDAEGALQVDDVPSYETSLASTSALSLDRRQTTPRANTSYSHHSVAGRSPWGLTALRLGSRKRHVGDISNASFLTSASFDVAHDRVLELLTDVAPWTAGWEDLRSIDLRGRRVESLVRLDEFLPHLEEARLDDNEIDYVTGLPKSLRSLSIANNRLSSTAAFGHLRNLETLDVSNNNVDLKALRSLVRLRHLYANNNRIKSIDGLQSLVKLETLHLRQNQLADIRIEKGQWPELQSLVLSRNALKTIEGLGKLKRLKSLNLDHNLLHTLNFEEEMPNLKQLRINDNTGLETLDVGYARNLHTLYADECALSKVTNIGMLHKLNNLSLRQQQGTQSLHWPAHEIRDVKRLFLSGNAFRAIDLSQASPAAAYRAPLRGGIGGGSTGITQFFGLVYLELSGCQLATLPDEFSDMVPNVRHLNADYNLLETLPSMNNLRRLKRLSLVGCRISKSRKLVESLQGCEELEFLDVRMNPCTLGLYTPIIMAAPYNAAAKRYNQAFMPPIPHPLFAGPAAPTETKYTRYVRSHAQGDEQDEEDGAYVESNASPLGEKSFFHKRRPAPPLFGDSTADDDDDTLTKRDEKNSTALMPRDAAVSGAVKNDLGDLFAASDVRFVQTLPPHFQLRRTLHRGSLAMACVNLTWLDGLLIDEEEVGRAKDHLQRRTRAAKITYPQRYQHDQRISTTDEDDDDNDQAVDHGHNNHSKRRDPARPLKPSVRQNEDLFTSSEEGV